MNEKMSLKQIERKAYTSYHQDGILDILIGMFIVGFATMVIADMTYLGWMFYIVAISIYASAKKVLTVPRIGFVKFPQQRTKRTILALVILGVLSNVLGLITFMQVESGSTPLWLLFAIENYMLVIGVFGATLFCIVGYTLRAQRTYAYALLTLLLFVIGYYLYYPLQYYLILLGVVVLLSGLAMLFRFVRKYPRPITGAVDESNNEEP
jgi:hypothetical protein